MDWDYDEELSLRVLDEMDKSIVKELGEKQIKRKVLVFFMEYDMLTGCNTVPYLMQEIERNGINLRELSDLMMGCQEEMYRKAMS